MAFNLLDLFGPSAVNRLLAPAPNTNGVQNMLLSRDVPQDPSAMSGAGMPQAGENIPVPLPRPSQGPTLDPSTVASIQGPAPSPTQGVQTAQAQQPDGMFGSLFTPDRKAMLNDFFLGLAAGATPQQSLALGAASAAQGSKGRKTTNQTVQWLKGRGLGDQEAAFLANNPAGLSDYLKSVYAAQKNQGLLNVGKGATLYDPASGKWITPPEGAGASAQDEYGLNPIYGKDADGNIVALQPGKHGSVNQLKFPDGVTITPPVQQTDLGTSVQYRDKFGNVIDNQQKDIRGKAAQEVLGKQEGGMEAAAPADYQSAQNALDTIDSIRKDPNKAWGTGASSWFNSIPGTPGRDFQNKVNAAKSGAFLTAIQQMRGLGSLSDAEGQAATKAVNRLDTATSEEEFNSALDDYEKIVRQGMARSGARMNNGQPTAQGGTQNPVIVAPPAANTTSSGVKWSIEP